MARHTNKRRGKSRRRQTRQRRRSQRGGGIFWDSTAEKIEKNNSQIKALQAENNQLQQADSTENKNGISWTDSIIPAFLKPNPNPNNPPVTPVTPVTPTPVHGGRRRRRRSQGK